MILVLILLAAAPLDEQRSAWKYRTEVALAQSAAQSVAQSATAGAFAVIPVSPNVMERSQALGSDWRLLSTAGDEIPYASLALLGLEELHEFAGDITDTRATPKKFSQWTVDLREPHEVDTIELGIDAQDFSKIAKLEGSLTPGDTFQVLSEGTTVFDVMWNPRVHHTSFSLAKSTRVRFLRVTFDDHTSPPVALRGVTARHEGARADQRFSIAATLSPRVTEGDNSVYALSLPSVPFDTVTVESSTPTFSRDVVLSRGTPAAAVEHGSIYRYAKDSASGARASFSVHQQPAEAWQLIISGDAAAPLKDITVRISGVMPRIVFPVSDSGPWTLYFGNAGTRAAHYDTEAFRISLGEHPEFAVATLGQTADNPRYAKPPPLRFVATTGAALDSEHYRLARRLILPTTEDIYSVTLLPEEVAAARDDLADVRISDGDTKQIPYVRSDEWIEKPLPLTLTKGDTGHVDHYVLGAPKPFAAQALLLDFQDGTYFSRVVRIIDSEAGANGHPRVLFESRIERQQEKQAPVRIALGEGRHSALTVEIDNGDNQPLTLTHAQALVRVPQLAFKAKSAGQTTLLVGNAEATRPDYDIASLRALVLAYAATPAESAESVSNPAYRRHASDYFRDAPPTLMIWGALVALLAVLLVLTARLVRKA